MEEKTECVLHSGVLSHMEHCTEDRRDMQRSLQALHRAAWVIVGGRLIALVTTIANYVTVRESNGAQAEHIAKEVVAEMINNGIIPKR